MTQASELLVLAERCEAATGPGRVLDRGIFVVTPDYEAKADRASGLWPRGGDKEAEERRWAFNSAPRYSASIDAALTLVPEGWRKFIRDSDEWRCICELESPDDQEIGVQAATWPLAVCAASLRALATKEK